MKSSDIDISWRRKFEALRHVALFRPWLSSSLIVLGATVALFEGIGLSFIYPIIQSGQSTDLIGSTNTILSGFQTVYELVGLPFTLEFLIIGIGLVMTVRFLASFFVAWMKAILQKQYEEDLRTRAVATTLDAEVGYFDDQGSDDILNAIITETRYSGRVIKGAVQAMEAFFLVMVYLIVMIYISPEMTILALVLLGGITILLRHIIEPAYTVGTRVAKANERVQQSVQAGIQGVRDVKLFALTDEIFEAFSQHINRYTSSSIEMLRNQAAIRNVYDLSAAWALFGLIYVGFEVSGLSLGALGIFLFAMFRLSPLMSRLNGQVYTVEGNISHLVRTQSFLTEVQNRRETGGSHSVSAVNVIEFDDVSFSYDGSDLVVANLSFQVEKGDYIACVGPSGAGKSTIVSLLARMYDPDEGEILGDGIPIDEYDLREWRDRIAIVRQQPFIFNDTLENNITIGNHEATREDVERVCRISKVDEFSHELPNAFDTILGDDGVRLSGGQRQRVALARALIKDADFLILDEATSDLDSDLEREVQRSIESMEGSYGIIAIAHRLSTVKNADTIYTLEDGEFIESGTHEELLERNGRYADLYSIQSKG